MSDIEKEGVFPLNELKEMKREIKEEIKEILDAGIKSIFDLFSQYTKTNDRDHQDLKVELAHLRDNDRDLYEKQNMEREKTNDQITFLRLDLEKRMTKLEIAPGKKAADNLRTIGMDVIKVIVGMAIVALVWAISQGAPIVP